MPEWLAVALGILAGLLILSGALAWAFWPRAPRRTEWLAPRSGREDPDPYSSPVDEPGPHL